MTNAGSNRGRFLTLSYKVYLSLTIKLLFISDKSVFVVTLHTPFSVAVYFFSFMSSITFVIWVSGLILSRITHSQIGIQCTRPSPASQTEMKSCCLDQTGRLKLYTIMYLHTRVLLQWLVSINFNPNVHCVLLKLNCCMLFEANVHTILNVNFRPVPVVSELCVL